MPTTIHKIKEAKEKKKDHLLPYAKSKKALTSIGSVGHKRKINKSKGALYTLKRMILLKIELWSLVEPDICGAHMARQTRVTLCAHRRGDFFFFLHALLRSYKYARVFLVTCPCFNFFPNDCV